MTTMLPVSQPNDAPLEKPADPNGWVCMMCDSVLVSMGDVRVSTTRLEDCPNCGEYASCQAAYVYRCSSEGRMCEDNAHHFGLNVHVEEDDG